MARTGARYVAWGSSGRNTGLAERIWSDDEE